jgi:hypothetical protein
VKIIFVNKGDLAIFTAVSLKNEKWKLTTTLPVEIARGEEATFTFSTTVKPMLPSELRHSMFLRDNILFSYSDRLGNTYTLIVAKSLATTNLIVDWEVKVTPTAPQ